MDPESGNVSVVFTASSAGTYTITGNFLGIDTGGNSHPVEILDDGTVLWKGTISSFGGKDSFNLSETLNKGGTLTFVVGTGSTGCSYCDLSTGLNGTITENTATVPSRALRIARNWIDWHCWSSSQKAESLSPIYPPLKSSAKSGLLFCLVVALVSQSASAPIRIRSAVDAAGAQVQLKRTNSRAVDAD